MAVVLDVTDEGTIDSAVRAGVERFGRIDVLVNNAGNFQPGFFEEISPIMPWQRSGHVVTITSTAGIVSGVFGSAYGASKFALEGRAETRVLSDQATALQELSTGLDHVEGV